MNVLVKNLGNGIKNIKINDPKTYNSLSFVTLTSILNTQCFGTKILLLIKINDFNLLFSHS